MRICFESVCACLLMTDFRCMANWRILFAGGAYLKPVLEMFSQPALLWNTAEYSWVCWDITQENHDLNVLKNWGTAGRFCIPSGRRQSGACCQYLSKNTERSLEKGSILQSWCWDTVGTITELGDICLPMPVTGSFCG